MLPQKIEEFTNGSSKHGRSDHGCCHSSGCDRGGPRSSPRSRRGWELAAGVVSLGVWALMPKCPICLAAYVALWTGLGLSFTAATYLRWSLLSLSGVLLIYLMVKRKVCASARP